MSKNADNIKKAKNEQKKAEKIRRLTNELNTKKKLIPLASGGVIVNRPTYLPSSGVMVGEHPTYSGRGTPRDGGPEALIGGAYAGAVVPLGADRAEKFIDPMSRSIAGAVMNQMAMEKIGMRGPAGMGSAPTNIVDSSTNTNVTNNTIIRTPSPSGPSLHFEGRDFVHKIA